MNMESFTAFASFETHNTKAIEIGGTRLLGTVSASYDELHEAFGEPLRDTDPGKKSVEWHIEFADGAIATIYDWRTEPGTLDKLRMWCLGADPRGGTTVTERIDSILSLRRELHQQKPEDKDEAEWKEKIAEPRSEILESVRVKFGEAGVQMAMHTAAMCRIRHGVEFMLKVLSDMKREDGSPIIPKEALGTIDASLVENFSQASGLMSKALGLEAIKYEDGVALMDMGKRIVEAEQRGLLSIVKSHIKSKGE